jgi:hypothetical protein
LQVAKTFGAQVTAQSESVGVMILRHIKQYQALETVPRARPLRFRIASAQGSQPPRFGQTIEPVAGRFLIALD